MSVFVVIIVGIVALVAFSGILAKPGQGTGKYDPNCAWYDFSCTSDPSGCGWWDIGCTAAKDLNQAVGPTEKILLAIIVVVIIGVIAIAFSPAARQIIPRVRVG